MLAASSWPYLGCRWARCLTGRQPPLASSEALLGSLWGPSSPVDCAVAPEVGSWCPLPLLPALLPLWEHRSAVGDILTQSGQGHLMGMYASMPGPGTPGKECGNVGTWSEVVLHIHGSGLGTLLGELQARDELVISGDLSSPRWILPCWTAVCLT